jgi:hypothetical protein
MRVLITASCLPICWYWWQRLRKASFIACRWVTFFFAMIIYFKRPGEGCRFAAGFLAATLPSTTQHPALYYRTTPPSTWVCPQAPKLLHCIFTRAKPFKVAPKTLLENVMSTESGKTDKTSGSGDGNKGTEKGGSGNDNSKGSEKGGATQGGKSTGTSTQAK